MGMKKSAQLMSLLAMAGLFSAPMYGEGLHTSKPKEDLPPKEPTPFKKQDGIVRMIEDYKLIQSGQSKKGKAKQARIVAKIESYLESGALTEEDVK